MVQGSETVGRHGEKGGDEKAKGSGSGGECIERSGERQDLHSVPTRRAPQQ